MDLSGSPWQPVEASLAARRPGTAWVEPVLDRQVVAEDADPAEQAVQRESIRLAFVSALQHLPPRQRAVLLLREVLRWRAEEVAQLLDTTVASVNSALQRARATMAAVGGEAETEPLDDVHRALLERYVDAFERYDVEGLVALLHEDATQHMPPFAMWLRGRADIGTWMLGPAGSAAAPVCCRPSPTGRRRSRSTAPAPAAGTSRGRCTCSRCARASRAHLQLPRPRQRPVPPARLPVEPA
jgi:RNA polymerase sigma-70 factor (ECF subfamily)